MTLTRRALLAGAATTATAALTGLSSARASAPFSGKQVTGFYRYSVGSFEVTVVTDGVSRFKFADDHVGNHSRAEVNAALVEEHLEPDLMTTPYNPIVVNTGSKLVLIDTGTGEASYIKSKGVGGQLLTNLAAAGIDPGAIDTVIISHYHGDHVNGLLTAAKTLAFPNAEILVPAVEHKYWTDDGEMSRAPKGRVADLFVSNRQVFSGDVLKRMRTYEWDKDVVPGIHAVGTPGHTPGHTSFVVASGAQSVYVQSDVTHVPFLFVRHPDWHAFYDQDPLTAQATRHKVYDMLVAEKMRVQGFHYPFPSLAHVEKAGDGYREIPVAWNPTI
jgi:glyoxylase-like metal-dependent hydrolase (beta-lactamase superfamily II)